MLSSLPCFYAFCWSDIPTSCYIFNVFYSCVPTKLNTLYHSVLLQLPRPEALKSRAWTLALTRLDQALSLPKIYQVSTRLPRLVPSRKKIGRKIRLVTLRTIIDTRSNFQTFRQEFEHANRNTAFFNHCNSEDRKCELRTRAFTILASVWLQLHQLTPWWRSAEVHVSTKNSAQCYQTDFSSNFSGWERDYEPRCSTFSADWNHHYIIRQSQIELIDVGHY